jgi:type I restriction enzyme S subunit
MVKLKNILTLSNTAVPSASLSTINLAGVYSFGRGLFKRGPLLPTETTYKSYNRLVADEFVISQPKAWEGAIARVTEEFGGWYLSPVFPTFRLDRQRVEPRYLEWFCKREPVWTELQRKSRGIGARRESVSPDQFLSVEIPLPPLLEQRRIVARIEALATKIEEARNVRHIASNETQIFLARQTGSIFDELARHHSKRAFGSYNPHITSGPRNWAKHYQEGGQRFYRAQDIGPNGEVLPDSKVFIEPPPGDQGRSASLQPGDLMLVITGATVGRCSVFRKELEPGFVSQHVGICRLPKESIDSDFALWGLRGLQGQEQLLGQRYGQGKPGLNLSNIRALTLPIPPLSEQQRIVAYLDSLQAKVDELKKLQSETSAELAALLPSILDKAFKGEL